jgi:hypothetical protein
MKLAFSLTYTWPQRSRTLSSSNPSSSDLALLAQAEISEQDAIKLLNKAAPAALLSYQTSAIDSAVAAYFDAQV